MVTEVSFQNQEEMKDWASRRKKKKKKGKGWDFKIGIKKKTKKKHGKGLKNLEI